MVPRLVPEGELLTANAVSGQVSNVSRLAGSALGGVLAASGGIVVAGLVMLRCLKEGEERVSLAPEKDTEKPVAACPGTA